MNSELDRMARLLVGDAEEVAEGLSLIHGRLRDRACGWLRSRFPGLSPEDLADAWGETLLGVLKAAREGRFDPDRPILRWLLTIAYRRAADITRRNSNWRGLTGDHRRLLSVLGLDGGSATGDRAARDAVETSLSVVRATIGALPETQQLVMDAFISGYPETRRLERLRARLLERSGREITIESVKSALREARKKIRRALRRRRLLPARGGDR